MKTFEECLSEQIFDTIEKEYERKANRIRMRAKQKRNREIDTILNVLIVLCLIAIFAIGLSFIKSVQSAYTSDNTETISASIKSQENVKMGSAGDRAMGVYNIPATEYADLQMYYKDNPEVLSKATFLVTNYCGCEKCCSIYSSGSESVAYGCKGDKLIANCSIATDPDVIPYGTVLWDEQGKQYIASDVGGAIKGYHIDLFVGDHEEALRLGKQYKTFCWEVQ